MSPEGPLAEARAAFCAQMESCGARQAWQAFPGRTAAVLFGGGARGGYQAGALLAFQDAGLPTHIVTATSIGSINAAGYVAHSEGLVGNAETLVKAWSRLSAPDVGIDWTPYLSMFIGLVIASVGFGNLMIEILAAHGFRLHPHEAVLTWFVVGIGGAVLLLLSAQPLYPAYVVRGLSQSGSRGPAWARATLSLLGVLAIAVFVGVAAHSIHLHSRFLELFRHHPAASLLVTAAAAIVILHRRQYPACWSRFAQRVLYLPLRAALFTDYQRERLLREHIPIDPLRASAIHTLFATVDLETGSTRFFCNHPPDQLVSERDVDADFVAQEAAVADDLIQAVMASSALPLAFEPVRIADRLYSDGAIAGDRPLRPAIRLGANVLFLVLTQPTGPSARAPKSFLDVGARAFDILMTQNLTADLQRLNGINATCERLAAQLSQPPEQVHYELGSRRYRYIKPFIIGPAASLETGLLGFRPKTTIPAVLQGYRDAAVQIANFLNYTQNARFGQVGRVLP